MAPDQVMLRIIVLPLDCRDTTLRSTYCAQSLATSLKPSTTSGSTESEELRLSRFLLAARPAKRHRTGERGGSRPGTNEAGIGMKLGTRAAFVHARPLCDCRHRGDATAAAEVSEEDMEVDEIDTLSLEADSKHLGLDLGNDASPVARSAPCRPPSWTCSMSSFVIAGILWQSTKAASSELYRERGSRAGDEIGLAECPPLT